jgi:hypothetical protein
MKTKTSFKQLYSFPGFRAKARFKCGVQGDPSARVVELVRRQKKASAPVADDRFGPSVIIVSTACGIYLPQVPAYTWTLNTAAFPARSAA